MNSDTNLIVSWVDKITAKLPYHSGQSFGSLEHDPVLRLSVISLIEVSKLRLPTVISGLTKSIEGISTPPPAGVASDRLVPLNVIQSNLFLIQLISVCMQQHWLYTDGSATHPNSFQRQLLDPPPLDNALAKHLLNLMLRFMYHSSDPSKEKTTFFTHYMYCYSDTGFIKGDWANFPVFMSQLHSSNIMVNVFEKTCRVIYYISASNWPLIFSKIKSYMLHLSTTSEEAPDTLMLRLLECSSLNARRLSMVLSELQLSFLHLKKNTQLNLAVLLRRGIWNWLEAYPTEFEDLQVGHKKLDASPEILFDMCNSLADTTRKKTYFWPLQNMLLILCPNILMNITMNFGSGSASKKGQFLNTLKTTIKGDHMSEISVICYTDICLAAYKLPKDGGSAVWNLVPDVIEDLQSWVFSPTKPYNCGSDLVNAGVVLDRKLLMRDADFALLQLSPKYFAESMERLVSDESFRLIDMKASRLKVGVMIETELTHQRMLPRKEYEAMANLTKRIFFRLSNMRQFQPTKTQTKSTTGIRLKSSLPHPLAPLSSSSNTNRNNKINDMDIDDMIHDILLIIRTNPGYILSCPDCISNPNEVANIVTTVASYLNDSSLILADVASSCLYALHQPEIIPLWDTSPSFLRTYWEISSQVIFAVSDHILNHRHGKGLGMKRLMNLLKQLLHAKLQILDTHQNAIPTEANVQYWSRVSASTEMTLLILLCSNDDFIYARVIDCFGLILAGYRVIENTVDAQLLRNTLFENIATYEELISGVDVVPGGRKSHQKRIWRILRQMSRCTSGNLSAWEEVWRRWKRITPLIDTDYTSKDSANSTSSITTGKDGVNETGRRGSIALSVFKARSESSMGSSSLGGTSNKQPPIAVSETSTTKHDDDPTVEWEYYTGFLSSLGQVCLATNDEDIQFIPGSPHYSKGQQDYKPPSTKSASPRLGPEYHRSGEGTSSLRPNEIMADEFVGNLVDLLVCDNLLVRERVREIMGGDMTAAFYWLMMKHFKIYMNACFSQRKPIYDAKRILFVEQSISVLRIMLGRSESADALVVVDFAELITQFCIYINALDDNDTSKKIKIKLCHFCGSLLSQRNQLSLHKNIAVRTLLLQCFHQWTSNFDFKSSDSLWRTPQQQQEQIQKLRHHHQKQDQDQDLTYGHQDLEQQRQQKGKSLTVEDNLQIDLDMACLKAMVVVLHQLPLQPTEPTRELNVIQRKSKMFFKYFTFFLQLLDRCKASEEVKDGDDSAASTSISRSNIGTFKDNIILCLSNLLSANVDVGLKYSLSMGYHQDIQSRSAFMQVLTNILNQGTEFDNLAETIVSDRYKKLVNMLFKFDYAITMSLCNVCPTSEIDNVATSLLASFASEKKSLILLQMLVTNEVHNTINESDLFRKTSIATKCLTLFARANGSCYVVKVLKPVIDELIQRPPSQQSYELDPTNVSRGYDKRNKENVISACNLILDAICNSSDMAPACLRSVCHLVLEAVKDQFMESRYTAVGCFVFLRFFCPVIVSPESAGLVKAGVIDKSLRRGLLLITKVIQNIANNVLFGGKEMYMVILNDFVTENMYRVTNYLRTMAYADINNSEMPKNTDVGISPRMNDADHRLLHSVLVKNFENIQNDLNTKKLLMFDNQDSMKTWNRYMEDFSMLLIQLGPPSETIRHMENFSLQTRHVAKDKNRKYSEFIQRNTNTDTNTIASSSICYAGGSSLAGHCVIYFIFRRMRTEDVEMETLMYHFFQVIENLYGKPFILVLDVTQFGPANEIPQKRVLQFCDLMPKSMVENMISILIYNTNTWFRKYLKMSNFPAPDSIVKRIAFAVNLKELAEFIHPSQEQLPKSTVALEKEPSSSFFHVSRILQFNVEVPVTIMVGAEYVQIICTKKQEIAWGGYAITNDVYHISELQGVSSTGNYGDNAYQVTFTTRMDRMVIHLRTPKYKQLLQAILQCKGRYDTIKPSTLSDRIIRPSDVPGRLLNMALLNLGSTDSRLRLAAYNLLYTLCRTFNFNVGTNLLDAKELCLPPNCFKFVAKISRRLAHTEKHLTLEFLNECFIGFEGSTEEQRYLCLHYMTPWIPNLGATSHGTSEEVSRTKEVLRMLIGVTVKRIHTSIQTKLWKTLGSVYSVRDIVLDVSVEISKEYGLGSHEAEAMANTCVTLSNIFVRSKLVANTLRLLRKTTYTPAQSLMDHPLWPDIAILTRFNLMLSFDNCGPMRTYVPDTLHIVTMLVGVGPTLIRTTILGITINLIQSLCISPKLSDENRRELQQLMGEAGEKRTHLMFGIVKPYANTFTITSDTLNDPLTGQFDLSVLQAIITILLRVIEIGAPTTDISNAWRSRWMGHISRVVFRSNPAVQPRAFVALGCLGKHQVNDDILYQTLFSLQQALRSFDTENPSLVLGIVMCLRDMVESVRSDSRYQIKLFWTALALLSINHQSLAITAAELLQGVLNSMEADHLFDEGEAAMRKLLFDGRKPFSEICDKLDQMNGINFNTHFSFAVSGILMKSCTTPQGKDVAFQCLLTFLNCATRYEKDTVNECVLGYVASLISVAREVQTSQDVLRFAGVHWDTSHNSSENSQYSMDNATYHASGGSGDPSIGDDGDGDGGGNSSLGGARRSGNSTSTEGKEISSSKISRRNIRPAWSTLFSKLDLPDNDTAILFLSCLVAQLKNAENESERLFLYELLSDAATIMPDVFSIVYPTMLPRMNQLIETSDSIPLLKALQSILLLSYSDSRFQYPQTTLKDRLLSLGFSVFDELGSPMSSSQMADAALLVAQVVEMAIQR